MLGGGGGAGSHAASARLVQRIHSCLPDRVHWLRDLARGANVGVASAAAVNAAGLHGASAVLNCACAHDVSLGGFTGCSAEGGGEVQISTLEGARGLPQVRPPRPTAHPQGGVGVCVGSARRGCRRDDRVRRRAGHCACCRHRGVPRTLPSLSPRGRRGRRGREGRKGGKGGRVRGVGAEPKASYARRVAGVRCEGSRGCVGAAAVQG